MATKLPFRSTYTSGDADKDRRWFEALENLGPEMVRMRLSQNDSNAGGRLESIANFYITKGFAEDWLKYRDARRARSTALRYAIVLAVSSVAAAASLAALLR